MTTPAQQIANQANAQLSTGPITPEGKAHSAANSRVHGLCSTDILIGPEEQPEFDHFTIGYYIELSPKGEVEQTLFDETVGAAWQLRRIRRMQTEACAASEDNASYGALLDDEVLQKKLDRLARHHTRIERTFHRCLKELKRMTAERRLGDATLIQAELRLRQLNAPTQISERTQSEAPPPPIATPISSMDDDSERLTIEALAGIERELDLIAPNLSDVLRHRTRQAA